MRTQFSVCRFSLPRCIAFLFVLCLLSAQDRPARAQAVDISVMFTPNTMMAMQGDTVNYTAMLTNRTAMDLLINGATFNSTDSNFFTTYGNFGFFNGTGMGDGSFTLAAMSSMTYTDVVSLALSPTVPAGGYDIDATFSGHNVGGSGDRDLGTGTLHVDVAAAGSPTPEFGSVWSLGGLLLAGGMGAWWQLRRRAPIVARESSLAS